MITIMITMIDYDDYDLSIYDYEEKTNMITPTLTSGSSNGLGGEC